MGSAANGDFETRQDRVTGGASVALRTNIDGITIAPTQGSGVFSGSAPHLTMSPVTSTGLQTMGAQFAIHLPLGGVKTAAIPVATGFVVTVWVRNSINYTWKKMAPVTFAVGGVADNDVMFITEDLDASELYFQVAAASVAVDGFIDFVVVEI